MKWFFFQFEENDVDPPSPQKKIQKEGMVVQKKYHCSQFLMFLKCCSTSGLLLT